MNAPTRDKTDALSPSPQLLCKLGSIIVHADELLSPLGHNFDREALIALLSDHEVQAWIEEMAGMAMVPLKRETS
jgi:hypothetical protein